MHLVLCNMQHLCNLFAQILLGKGYIGAVLCLTGGILKQLVTLLSIWEYESQCLLMSLHHLQIFSSASVMESCKNTVLVQWLLSSDWNFFVLWTSAELCCAYVCSVQLYICRNSFATLIHLELYFMRVTRQQKQNLAQDKCW